MMKYAILTSVSLSVILLLLGSDTQSIHTSEEFKELDPVVIQIKEIDHPFDVDGRFPYVVLINGVVYKFTSTDVESFISKRVIDNTPTHNRIRFVTTNTN